MKASIILLLLIALVAVGFGAWLAFLPNVPASDAPYSVRLPPGTTFEAALDSLEADGALSSRASLSLFGGITGWGDQVKTGHYNVEPGMSNWALLDKIRKGLQDPIRITIPGGLTPERFGRVLERQLGADSAAVVAAVNDPALADSLGTDVANLFGHMRANTYDILWTTDARRAVSRIHGWHDRYWDADKKAKAEALGLTPDEVTTMASIVEWEAQKPSERPRIAGVYLNRLLGRTPAGRMPLQADPTVQYAMMKADGGPMRRLFNRDYAFPSPYNTYQNAGLPPGPINNPSDDTIDGVLNNEKHGYLYFVADGTGGHRFATTLSEHNANAAAWSRFITEQTRIKAQREAAGQ